MMRLVRSFHEVPIGLPTVCCIGTFDGVHKGHQHLIGAAVREAHQRQMRSAVITFFPHPRAVLGRTEERYLTLPKEKAERLAALGVDVLLIHEFTAETIHTRAEEFIGMMLSTFDLRSLWAGPDFAFGYRREGTTAWLHDAAIRHGFDMHVAEPFVVSGRPVSSSRVREALLRGDMEEVSACLGRPYLLAGHLLNNSDPDAQQQIDMTNGSPAEQGRQIALDRQQWRPADGEYSVHVNGEANCLLLERQGTVAILKKELCIKHFGVLEIFFA